MYYQSFAIVLILLLYTNTLLQHQPLISDAQSRAADAKLARANTVLAQSRFSVESLVQVLSNFPGEQLACDPRRATIHPRATYSQKFLSMALVKQDDELVIKPEAVAPNVNYADWPLLLKNWDQRMSLHQPVIGSAVRLQTLRASTP